MLKTLEKARLESKLPIYDDGRMIMRAMVEQQQKTFTESWDPLFIAYLAAVYFHTCETKINSWTTQAKKMPPKNEVREVLKTLEKARLESKLPIYDDGRMIVEESHLALKDEKKFGMRKYGLQEVELQQEGRKMDAAGVLYVPLTDYKAADPTTLSPCQWEPQETEETFQWRTDSLTR